MAGKERSGKEIEQANEGEGKRRSYSTHYKRFTSIQSSSKLETISESRRLRKAASELELCTAPSTRDGPTRDKKAEILVGRGSLPIAWEQCMQMESGSISAFDRLCTVSAQSEKRASHEVLGCHEQGKNRSFDSEEKEFLRMPQISSATSEVLSSGAQNMSVSQEKPFTAIEKDLNVH